MLDVFALKAIQNRDEDALARLIEKYAAYVGTIVRNILRNPEEDVEEVVADVFAALWHNANRPSALKLKSYLGGIARNKAKNKLRERLDALPLEEDYIVTADSGVEDGVLQEDERQKVITAILALKEPDREIFLRHYYDLQHVAAIAAALAMSESAVKKRLIRGREKLKTILEQGGNQL
ncbi:MAG: sigma-70 family RNA polymerase sigma factor [Peptococcaceae bacterium]|jgi:RNA polymerase sigma-70 factor (ECF subfamily)|nr:sigma-70 family RNA polymerase sigma factor [Peptococcaceae bacterium]